MENETTQEPPALRALMPRNRDNIFWIDGLKRGELLIQRCQDCGILRHPPGPMCGHCHSMKWDTVAASGKGHIYSYTVHHKPPIPGFSTPFAVLLVELEEGTRIIGNLVGAPPSAVRIGMPVELVIEQPEFGSEPLPNWRLSEAAS